MPSLFSLAALASGSLGCSKKSDGASTTAMPAAPPPAPRSSASAATAVAEASAPSGPCQLEGPPVIIETGARTDTGVTLARLPDDRFAVGYATSKGPRIAILQSDGSASVVEVDASHIPEIVQKPARVETRHVNRVTPIGPKGLAMRAAVDVTVDRPDGTRLVRCGAADDEGLFRFDGASAYAGVDAGGARANPELRECRSFSAKGALWALAFDADTSGEVESRWVVGAEGAPLDADHASIEHTVLPADGAPARGLPRVEHLTRYGYTLLASVRLEEAGYLVASRYNGKLRLAKRAADWTPAGKVTDFWFGTAIGMPALAARDAKAIVLVPLAGTRDLYGAAFAFEAVPPTPERVAIEDPVGAGEPLPHAERTAVSAAIDSKGQVVAAFLDGGSGKRRPRLALLSESLKPRGPAVEPLGTGADDVEDVKVAVLPDDRVLVAMLVAKTNEVSVEAAVLRCARE